MPRDWGAMFPYRFFFTTSAAQSRPWGQLTLATIAYSALIRSSASAEDRLPYKVYPVA
jgi:hypothetical protein